MLPRHCAPPPHLDDAVRCCARHGEAGGKRCGHACEAVIPDGLERGGDACREERALTQVTVHCPLPPHAPLKTPCPSCVITLALPCMISPACATTPPNTSNMHCRPAAGRRQHGRMKAVIQCRVRALNGICGPPLARLTHPDIRRGWGCDQQTSK